MKCQRCGGDCSTYRVSWFDTAVLCPSCQVEEEKHPDFRYARETENAAVRNGDYNFPGVGWPGRDGRVQPGAEKQRATA